MSTLFGARDEVSVDEVRVARIAAARGCQVWTEIDGPLIARGPWWVHPESDRLYTEYRGEVFMPGSASIAFADRAPLVFTVEGERLTLFEAVVRPGTWSEVVARRAKQQARA